MFTDEQAHPVVNSILCSLTALVLTGALVLVGCDSNEDADENQIAAIAISPDSTSLAVGEHKDFSVVALTASGDTVRDAELSLRWWSTDSTVFTVEDDGLATGQAPGTALCKVEVNDEAASKTTTPKLQRFVGLDSAFVMVF